MTAGKKEKALSSLLYIFLPSCLIADLLLLTIYFSCWFHGVAVFINTEHMWNWWQSFHNSLVFWTICVFPYATRFPRASLLSSHLLLRSLLLILQLALIPRLLPPLSSSSSSFSLTAELFIKQTSGICQSAAWSRREWFLAHLRLS